MPRKTAMELIDASSRRPCIGCDVLIQKDETNEQNINFHRQEMADAWRRQEESNKATQENTSKLGNLMANHVEKLNAQITIYMERINTMEKRFVYTAVVVASSALVTAGSVAVMKIVK